ncbi:MAG: HK97 gp10 family phage protein [Pseudodesulfovibrio sp.]|nr:HK97 gp10 family phage protein [Pseudodesulfovibrio sp.]
MIKSSVRVDLGDFGMALDDINQAVEANIEKVADIVVEQAKSSAAFEDQSGDLRRSIKKRKSKYWDGGYIVLASDPKAHLIEFGHDIIRNGKIIGQVPALPFLSPAKEMGIRYAVQAFQAAG